MSRQLSDLYNQYPPSRPVTGKPRLGWWQLRALFGYLVWRANEQDHLRVWCSQDTMLRETGFSSKRDVQNGLRDLQDLGLITKVGKHGRADVYEVSTAWLPSEHRQAYLPDDRQACLPDRKPVDIHGIGQDYGQGIGQDNGQAHRQAHRQAYLPQTEQEPNHLQNPENLKLVRRTPDGAVPKIRSLVGDELRRLLDDSIAEGHLERTTQRAAK